MEKFDLTSFKLEHNENKIAEFVSYEGVGGGNNSLPHQDRMRTQTPHAYDMLTDIYNEDYYTPHSYLLLS